jgi:catechol 2,3-dioxygenase-like lactoylglutathione lyase family enzyme
MATFLTYPPRTASLMSATRSFTRIDSIVLRVRSRQAAVAWYRSSLGLQLLFEHASAGMAVLGVGQGYSLTLWELRPGEECTFDEKACAFPIFEAVDARRQRLDLQSRGVVTSELREAPGLRCFSFWDLDGNRLDACEVVESPPA